MSCVFPQRSLYRTSCRRQRSRSPLGRTHAHGSTRVLLAFRERGNYREKEKEWTKEKDSWLCWDLLKTPRPITFPTSSWGLAAASWSISSWYSVNFHMFLPLTFIFNQILFSYFQELWIFLEPAWTLVQMLGEVQQLPDFKFNIHFVKLELEKFSTFSNYET